MSVAAAQWLTATIVVTLCAVAAIVGAAARREWMALPSIVPLAAGVFIKAADVDITQPDRAWIVALSVAVIVLAVASGGPLVTWVLQLTDPAATSTTGAGGQEILRGGATIGYLERIAVVIAVGLGQIEIVAAVIAIKGLGRFTELATSAARERFIIGTLVSLLWSGLAAGLVWPPG